MDFQLLINAIEIDWSKIAPESYLRSIPAIKDLNGLAFHKSVTFFTGENGSGKSTLLEGIAVAAGYNPEGGTRNYLFSTYDSHSELYRAIRLIRGARRPNWGYFLRAESFYNVATKEEEYGRLARRGGLHLHEKSHGESFLELAENQFDGGGLYLLDEPEAALSPQKQLTLLLEIDRCAKRGAQFIIATHSPILTALPGAEIWSFDEGHIHPCAYEETGSYRVTELFINRREQVLRHLLEE